MLSAPAAKPSASKVTVIIPTYNRSAYLRLCLSHLELQTEKHFDVIVVDDGSTDNSGRVLAEECARTLLRLRVITQPNGKVPRARNRGVAEAQTNLCILIGDDILVSPQFVEVHLRLHRQHPEENVAALGLTRWDTVHQQVTPFMEWQEAQQFDYAPLLAGEKPSWNRFYSSNLSCKTSLLREVPWNESFVGYGFDDIEHGYRLTQLRGLEIVFVPEALAAHLHPTTFLDAARRMRQLGRSEHRLHQYAPELRPRAPGWKAWVSRMIGRRPALLEALTRMHARFIGDGAPGKYGSMLLHSHHARGYMEFGNELNSSAARHRSEVIS